MISSFVIDRPLPPDGWEARHTAEKRAAEARRTIIEWALRNRRKASAYGLHVVVK